MKCLICGAGKIAHELMKRLGEKWQVTVIDKDEKRLNLLSNQYVSVMKIFTGDASSPVVLEEAGLAGHDFVLALTNNDRVNLAIVKSCKDHEIPHVLTLIYDPELRPKARELGARSILVTSAVARKIYHYLQDPRVNITSIGQGAGELLEMEISANFDVSQARMEHFSDRDWRIIGLLRDNEVLFPDADLRFREKDRLLILGKPDLFGSVCTVMECSAYHFPMTYGQELVLAVPLKHQEAAVKLINESFYVGQNTKILKMTVLCEKGACAAIQEKAEKWSESLDMDVQVVETGLNARLRKTCAEKNAGLAVLPPLERSFFKSLTKSALIELGASLECPVLISRFTHPYDKILVPFDGSRITLQGLEIAIDMAKQIGGEVSVVVVEEPDFLHGDAEEEDEHWMDKTLKKVRELGHAHKIAVKEIIRQGNPVQEITGICPDYNLMVIGTTNQARGIFTPNVGEILIQKAACSALLVTQ